MAIPMPALTAIFFADSAAFRAWLEKHYGSKSELIVGFYKKSAQRAGLTYAEAVDEALCFGWIDGVVRSLDEERYCHRFTPRRAVSTWSNVNVRHMARLEAAGKLHPAGRAAFAARTTARTGTYAFEAKTPANLPAALEKRFRAHRAAWTFFNAQPPGYRRGRTFWVATAKQAATRERRLDRLITASAARRRL